MRTQKVTYNAGQTLVFSISHRPWVGETVGIGAGIEMAGSGVPSAWITRRERPLGFGVRFRESEWPAVRAWIEYGQLGGAFQWFPDSESATSYTCYLVSPEISERVRPTPGQFLGELELQVAIRRADGEAIDEAFFV